MDRLPRLVRRADPAVLEGLGLPGRRRLLSTSIGTDTLCLLAIGVVANDVGALVLGSAAGKSPLRAWISPNKSVEGLFGGTVATILAMVIVGLTDRSTTWNSAGDLIILGIVISIMAPLGDLTESMFKRNLDIKDFGTLVRATAACSTGSTASCSACLRCTTCCSCSSPGSPSSRTQGPRVRPLAMRD